MSTTTTTTTTPATTAAPAPPTPAPATTTTPAATPPVTPTVAPVPAAALYDPLGPIYDRWQSSHGMTPFALVVLAKLLPALERHGRAGVHSFLDLGCGTGELLLGLGRAHPAWRLAGVDGSQGMLDDARRKPGAGNVAWVWRPLAGQWALPPPAFDAAGCFYDTLNHLTDLPALGAMVGGVAAALRPGGLFIFDATNETGFDAWWRGKRTWRGPDWSVTVETRYDPKERLGHAEVTIEDRDRRSIAHLTERCFSLVELRVALTDAALEVVAEEPWSPFNIDAPGKTWWTTRKKPI